MSDVVYFAKVKEDAKIPSKRVEDGGYDVYANFEEDYITIKPNEIVKIPTGIASAFSSEYVFVGKERGSTGTKGMSFACGVIDSGYRGEWLVPINNTSDKVIIITKDTDEVRDEKGILFYPYNKAIAQVLLVPVPVVELKEISYEELKEIPSDRADGKLGSSGK